MKNRVKKPLSLLLAVVMMLCVVPMRGSATQSRSGNFSSNYSYSSNPADYILNIAQAQIGRTKSQMGYTEAWCADFVGDCAKLANQDSAIPLYGGCNGLITKVLNAGGKKVTSRKKGDLIFYYCSACACYVHVGLVLDGTYTIEGNYNGKVTKVSGYYRDSENHNTSSGTISKVYVRPNYSGSSVSAPTYAKLSIDQSVICTGQTVTFTLDSDTADHYTIGINKNGTRILTQRVPHIFYYTCTEAGSYTAYISAVNDGGYVDSNVVSWTVKPCTDFSGSFKVKASSKVIRKGPASSYNVVKTVYSGDTINVVGYTYNEVGNLWYKTDSGNFIFHSCLENIDGTALPSSNYLNATAKVMSSSKSVWSYPNGKTDPVSELKSGDIVDIIGYLYNEYGTLWYELSNGTYVNSSYLKFITSNIRTPSNYYINTYKITASQKTLKSDPYSSSETTRELKKGDTVATVFYMYNRYGNLWYMTDNYDFIYESYLLPKEGTTDSPSVYCYRSFDCNTDKIEQSEPYAVATTVKTISKNSRIDTIGYVINLYGNKWYQTVDGGFVYDSELMCVHTYDSGKITTAATCKSTGVKTYTCTICKTTKTETVAKNPSNHAGGTAVKNSKAATCTAKGYTGDIYCLGCGVTTSKGREISAKGHSYDSGKITTTATCKSTGIKTYTCNICKTTKTEIVAKNPSNHAGGTAVKNSKAATCTAKGYTGDTYCLGCGVTTSKGREISAKGHSYDSGKITTTATCKATGVKTYTCTVCKATKTETVAKLNHRDSNGDGKCDMCGFKVGESGKPDTPDDSSNNCNHICHKSGFKHFLYIIVRMFWRLFKINQVCDCGFKHY